MQVAHDIVADAVWSVVDGLRDFDTVGAVEFVQLVGVADDEIDRASLRTGSGRSFLQANLRFAKVHAGASRALTPGERRLGVERLDGELVRGSNVIDRQGRVDLRAFAERSDWVGHNIGSFCG